MHFLKDHHPFIINIILSYLTDFHDLISIAGVAGGAIYSWIRVYNSIKKK